MTQTRSDQSETNLEKPMTQLTDQQRRLADLQTRKAQIEADIQTNVDVLASNNMKPDDSVLDSEGFPRADIDVLACRTAKKNIIELRNDFRAVMEQMSQALIDLHQGASSDNGHLVGTSTGGELEPIAVVDDVQEGSPAHEAGLQIGDLLMAAYESANGEHFQAQEQQTMRQVEELVMRSENKAIMLQVRRNQLVVSLSLTPKRWQGRGLLGCHLRPL